MSPDLPDQMYAELIQIREQERLTRRAARERKAARSRPGAWTDGRLGRGRAVQPDADITHSRSITVVFARRRPGVDCDGSAVGR